MGKPGKEEGSESHETQSSEGTINFINSLYSVHYCIREPQWYAASLD